MPLFPILYLLVTLAPSPTWYVPYISLEPRVHATANVAQAMASLWAYPIGTISSPPKQCCCLYRSSLFAARQAHVMHDLHIQSLLSIGLFCDHGFQVHFNKNATHIANSDTTIHGIRDPSNRFYYIELNPQSSSPASGPGPIAHATNSA